MKILILIAMLILTLGFAAYGCNSAVDADQARADKAERDWLTFSMQHHCHVSKPSTFTDPNETWACDGFEVVRR